VPVDDRRSREADRGYRRCRNHSTDQGREDGARVLGKVALVDAQRRLPVDEGFFARRGE
jgi:hypothetical protein